MYKLFTPSQSYQICTGGSPAILHDFLQSHATNVGTVPRLDRDRLRPDPFQHIFHETSYHSTLYTDTDSVVNNP